jgi:hypothetical protein
VVRVDSVVMGRHPKPVTSEAVKSTTIKKDGPDFRLRPKAAISEYSRVGLLPGVNRLCRMLIELLLRLQPEAQSAMRQEVKGPSLISDRYRLERTAH